MVKKHQSQTPPLATITFSGERNLFLDHTHFKFYIYYLLKHNYLLKYKKLQPNQDKYQLFLTFLDILESLKELKKLFNIL